MSRDAARPASASGLPKPGAWNPYECPEACFDDRRAVKPQIMVGDAAGSATRVAFRFPGGDFEVTYGQQAPRVGEIVLRRGRPWMVEQVEHEDGAAVIRLQELNEEAHG